MWKEIYYYEIRYLFRLPFTYILLIGAFSMSSLLMLGTGGYFDGTPDIDTEVVALNSAHQLVNISFFFIKSILFIIPIIIGLTLHKDISSKMYQVLYAYPLNKLDYILGKLLAIMSIVCSTSLLLSCGIICGELIMGIENPFIKSFSLAAHACSLLIIQLPTILTFSLILMAVVGMTRNQYSGFIAVIIIQLFQIILENTIFDHATLLGLLDPYGQNTFYLVTSKWNTETINAGTLPINSLSIYNKLIWLLIASMVFFYYYKQFEFNVEFKSSATKSSKQKQIHLEPNRNLRQFSEPLHLDFSFLASIKTVLYMSVRGFKQSVFNWIFLLLLSFGIFSIFVIQIKTSQTGQFTIQAFTSLLISTPLHVYVFIVLVSSFLTTGRLVLEDKQTGINELIDASPVSTFQLIASKFLAISYTQVFMLFNFILVGIIVQYINGIYDFELGLYFKHIFLVVFPSLALWSLISICVFTFIPNLYFGVISLIGLIILPEALRQIKVSTYLLSINNLPEMRYNDIYHYGANIGSFMLVLLYWSLIILVISTIAYFYWQRGITDSILNRIRTAAKGIGKKGFLLLTFLIAGSTITGFKIYQAEQSNNKQDAVFSNSKLKTFKNKWSEYAHISQPIITDIHLNLQLYPSLFSFSCHANYTLKNESQHDIDTLLIRTGFDEQTIIHIDQAHDLIDHDPDMKYHLIKLSDGIISGDSINVRFDIKSKDNQLFRRNSGVLNNGTYLRNDILPRLSYQFKKDHTEDIIDSTKHFYADDSHYINLETVISTDKDQTAIAPGRLSNHYIKNERAVYHYHTDHPLKFNFSFQSGKYNVHHEEYQGKHIEVYTHPKHGKYVDDMISGLKASLNYNEAAFTTYPFKDLRIIEFPATEGDYSATLMANNIPCNELLFCLNNDKMKDKLNLPFYVMAHELTHEWFGNQLMPANDLGAKMLTESITEYLTLNIYESELGIKMKRSFLEVQLNRYLNGKRNAGTSERPLFEVDNEQEYIAYGKGTLIFNRLAYVIGKEKLIKLLSTFHAQNVAEHKYPNGHDFVQYLYEHISVEHHELIEELFEKIISYDHKLSSYKKLTDTSGELSIELVIEEGQASINEIELAYCDDQREIIKIERLTLEEGVHLIKINPEENVKYLILDPNYIYIDQNRDNNTIEL